MNAFTAYGHRLTRPSRLLGRLPLLPSSALGLLRPTFLRGSDDHPVLSKISQFFVLIVDRADCHAHIPLDIRLVLGLVIKTMAIAITIAVHQTLDGRDDAKRLALLLALLLLLALPAAVTDGDAGAGCSCRGVAVTVAIWQTIGFRRRDGLICGF